MAALQLVVRGVVCMDSEAGAIECLATEENYAERATTTLALRMPLE